MTVAYNGTIGFVCDPDRDDDGTGDSDDNCPDHANAQQTDTDGDGMGDACDPFPNTTDDRENDGVADAVDNCPDYDNPQQVDTDADGLGDACDVFRADADNGAVGPAGSLCENYHAELHPSGLPTNLTGPNGGGLICYSTGEPEEVADDVLIEWCNGRDDNRDALVDEGFTKLGEMLPIGEPTTDGDGFALYDDRAVYMCSPDGISYSVG